MDENVSKAREELDAVHDQRFAPWRNQWHTIRAELTRLTEIADGVDPLVIRLGEVTTRLEAADALLRTIHDAGYFRMRIDAHLSENTK